jgi:hypothetical protein
MKIRTIEGKRQIEDLGIGDLLPVAPGISRRITVGASG